MTLRQKRIVAALALANTLLILALVVLVTHSFSTHPSPLPPSYTPISPAGACQWQATQLLAQVGLGGTVTLIPAGSLRFEITYPLAPGQMRDEAAQAVWAAFDVARALQEGECDSFTQVEVTILAQANQTDTRIHASVSAADLAAFGAGALSEDEFIERVAYTVGNW